MRWNKLFGLPAKTGSTIQFWSYCGTARFHKPKSHHELSNLVEYAFCTELALKLFFLNLLRTASLDFTAILMNLLGTLSITDFFAPLKIYCSSQERWKFSLFVFGYSLFSVSRDSTRFSNATVVLVIAFIMTSFSLSVNGSFSISSLVSLSLYASWLFLRLRESHCGHKTSTLRFFQQRCLLLEDL